MGVCSFSGHLVENNNDGRGLAYLFVFALLFLSIPCLFQTGSHETQAGLKLTV